MAPGGRWPRMGSGPATPVKGRPGSRGSGRSPSSDAGWLLRRPPGPFAGRPARACRQDRSVLRGVPRPVWLPPAVPSSVIGSRANLGPRLPPPTSVSFLQMRRVSPRVERCNKKPRVPTSRGRSTEPRLPPALPLLFLRLVCPGAGGQARARGEPPSCAEPGTGAHVSTHAHAHTCTHTHAYAHTHRTLCRAVRQRRERRVFSPRYLFPSLLAPWPVSSAGNRHPPATRPHPPSAWSQLRVWPEQPSTGKPPFTGPLATRRVGFLRDDPLELEWEGGELSSRNRPQHPTGRNISAEGFPSRPLDVRAAFLSWQAGGRARSVAWLEFRGSSQTNFPGLGGARQHPLFCRPCELARARGPDLCPTSHKVKSVPAPLWGWRATLGSESLWGTLRCQLTAHLEGSPVPFGPPTGGGFGEVCVFGVLVAR